MQDTKAFAPFYKVSTATAQGGLIPSITIVTTAGAAAASGRLAGEGGENQQIQVANITTSSWVYLNFGVLRDALTVTAATVADSLPVPPNSTRIFTVGAEVNAASAIMGTAGVQGNVILTRGSGV